MEKIKKIKKEFEKIQNLIETSILALERINIMESCCVSEVLKEYRHHYFRIEVLLDGETEASN